MPNNIIYNILLYNVLINTQVDMQFCSYNVYTIIADESCKGISWFSKSKQISRIAVHGHIRAIQPGEVLVEQGERAVPFFVVVSGEIEIVRPCGGAETLVTIHGPGQFTGDVYMLSGRRTIVRMRAIKPGE